MKIFYIILSILLFFSCSRSVVEKNNKQASKVVSVENLDMEPEVEDAPDLAKTTEQEKEKKLSDYCQKVDKDFLSKGWGKSSCSNFNWRFVRSSVSGDPLIWTTFGNYVEGKNDVTLIMCGVHGDEITPVKFCFDILNHIETLKSSNKLSELLNNKYLIIAPVVNPDSFFKARPTRTNANGVDINRNFPTEDYQKLAYKMWKERYKKDPRRFPGKMANSEPEVLFQVNLIKRYSPKKIISVHAPLTMLDYDGPADQHTGGFIGTRANQLLIQMSEKAKGYRIKNYPFFPGSLGNYAGNERNIPTYTLELPSSDARKSDHYWNLFKDSIISAINHDMAKDIDVALKSDEDSSVETQ